MSSMTEGSTAPSSPSWVIRKNVVFVGYAYGIGAAAGFVAQAVIARKLGPVVFGEYIAALSLVTILAVLYEAASTDYLVRETAREPSRLGELLGDLLLVKVVAAAAVGTLAVCVGLALGFTGAELALAGLIAVMLGANAVARPFRAGLQGVERMGVVSALSIVNSVLSAAGMVVLVAMGHGILTALAFSALVSLALVPVSWLAMMRHTPVSPRASLSGARTVVREGLPFTTVTLLTYATSYADAIVIRVLLGLTETGQYGAAYRLFVVLQFLPAIYLDSVLRTHVPPGA